MTTFRSTSVFVCLLAVSLAVGAACAAAAPPDSTEAPTLSVDLSDYKIVSDRPTITAGHVVMRVRDRGSMAHELKVIRTDLAPDKLPIDGGSAKAKEDGKVGELLNIAPGSSRTLVLDLGPGSYVLICNIPGHYQLGMRLGLEVTVSSLRM